MLERFQELTDDSEATENHIPKGHRICIVAPRSDEGLCRIVEWLKMYDVPISFVPFTLYTDDDNEDILLEMEPLPKIQAERENVAAESPKDWCFNTNETHAPGAYENMFYHGVIAIYGYANGSSNLQGSTTDQRVFAYVNKKGILAVGSIVDGQVVPGNTVFGKEQEFHVKVNWETIVSDEKGVTNKQVKQEHSRGLPVRNVFCGIPHRYIADWIADELRRRAK